MSNFADSEPLPKRSRPSVDASNSQFAKVVIENRESKINTFRAIFAGVSFKGHAPSNPLKENQDSLLFIDDPKTDTLILSCLDGHGSHGHTISRRIRDHFETQLMKHSAYESDIIKAFVDTTFEIETILLADNTINCDFSGSTFTAAIFRGNILKIINIGDSRIVLGLKRGKDGDSGAESESISTKSVDDATIASGETDSASSSSSSSSSSSTTSSKVSSLRLSRDHKPDLPDEKSRITQSGGRVFALLYPDGVLGPARVWLSKVNSPGLAMSRSICDRIAHSCGVITTPEVAQYELDLCCQMTIIVGTDGLWEFFEDQEVVDVAMACTDPSDATQKLYEEAKRRWQTNECIIDDISLWVAHLSPC